MPERPLLVALTETWLDASTGAVCLAGYSLISRHDRGDGRQGGGVALFAASAFADNVVFIAHSDGYERSWSILHTSVGPLSFCVWYRPPAEELNGIWAFVREFTTHSETTVGSIIVGDFNVHNARWLHHSSGISQEGRILEQGCATHNLKQHVRGPTRGDHLLGLVLTGVDVHVDVTVQPPLPIIARSLLSSVCLSLHSPLSNASAGNTRMLIGRRSARKLLKRIGVSLIVSARRLAQSS